MYNLRKNILQIVTAIGDYTHMLINGAAKEFGEFGPYVEWIIFTTVKFNIIYSVSIGCHLVKVKIFKDFEIKNLQV